MNYKFGVTFELTPSAPVPGVDDKLDLVHDMLVSKAESTTVDIALDGGNVAILIGIDVPSWSEAPEAHALGLTEMWVKEAFDRVGLGAIDGDVRGSHGQHSAYRSQQRALAFA